MIVLWVVFFAALAAAAFAAFVLFKRTPGKTFDSAGVPVYYTDEGAGAPVLLIHGFAVHADLNWRRPGCVRRLRNRGYRVITMDLRGHGRSGRPYEPEKYGVELADDAVRLLDHLGIDKAHVAGYSLGGFVTLKIITRHPDRLLSGIVCAAGWDELDEKNRALFGEIVAAIEQRRVFDPITDWLDPGKRAPRIQCALANFFMRLINDLPAIVNCFKSFDGLVVDEAALRANTVPALVLVGERDGIREASDKLPGVMANHELVHIPGGDHLTTLLKPLFMERMLAFLDQHTPRG